MTTNNCIVSNKPKNIMLMINSEESNARGMCKKKMKDMMKNMMLIVMIFM